MIDDTDFRSTRPVWHIIEKLSAWVYIMNQPLFKPTSYTPPAVYHHSGVAFHPHIPQTFTPMYKNQEIVDPRPQVPQNRPANYLNSRPQQAQSYIFPNQNRQADQNRTLKLDSFARKVSYQEQNNGSIQQPNIPNARLNNSIQRTLDPRQTPSPFNPNLNQNNKRPLFVSEMLTNQDFRIDLNSKKIEQSDLKIPRQLPQKQEIRVPANRAQMRLSLNGFQREADRKQSKTDRENTVNKTANYMNYIGTNLKYRHFPTNNSINPPNIPTSQSLQSSSSKNTAMLDNTHSTQSSSQSQSNSQNEEGKVRQMPTSTPIQKSNSPVNFWPLSISPYQQRKQTFPNPPPASANNDKKMEVKEKTDACAQFKKKKPLQFLNKSKQKIVQYPIKSFKISDFELLDKVGKGSFGDVYLAQQKLTGFLVVIKKLQKKKIAEMKVEQHLLREIKIQSFLRHRHLTSIYGFFSDETHVYLILQIMPDGSIMQVKKKRKISQAETSSYIRQICEGLKYMHAQEIIHRDIKPENIFLNNGYAKIGDFGCSIYTQSLRKTIIGSLAYISPEQLKQQSYDQKIDVWSLGVMAYQMMIGKSPYQEDIIKIAKNQIAPELSELKFPPEIELSQEAKDFLAKMLHLDPNQRIGISDAVKHEFIRKHIGKDEPVSN